MDGNTMFLMFVIVALAAFAFGMITGVRLSRPRLPRYYD